MVHASYHLIGLSFIHFIMLQSFSSLLLFEISIFEDARKTFAHHEKSQASTKAVKCPQLYHY